MAIASPFQIDMAKFPGDIHFPSKSWANEFVLYSVEIEAKPVHDVKSK